MSCCWLLQPYSAGPKPYADSYNAVSSMTSHTASLSIGLVTAILIGIVS